MFRRNNEKKPQEEPFSESQQLQELQEELILARDRYNSVASDILDYKSRLKWLQDENTRLRSYIEERLQRLEQSFNERFDLLASAQVRIAGEAHLNPANVYTHVRPSRQHIELQKTFMLLRDTHFENAAKALMQMLLATWQVQIAQKALKASLKASLAHHLLDEESKQETGETAQMHEQVFSLVNAVLHEIAFELKDQLSPPKGKKPSITSEVEEAVARLIVAATRFRSDLEASTPPGVLRWYKAGEPLNLREHIVSGSGDEESNSERSIARTLIPAYFVGKDVMGEALVQVK